MKSTNPFGKLLRRSPFEPIQKHMRVVGECVSLLPELFEALGEGDRARVKAAGSKINKLESKADAIKHDYRFHMPSSLFLPVARRDLLMLISEQDSIADTANGIARIFSYRKMDIPERLGEPLTDLIEGSVAAFNQALKVVEQLDELLEGGFKGKESKRVRELIAELRVLEEAADKSGARINRALFAIEDQLPPVSVMFWYQLIDRLGEISDLSENVGDRVIVLIAR